MGCGAPPNTAPVWRADGRAPGRGLMVVSKLGRDYRELCFGTAGSQRHGMCAQLDI